MIDKIAIQFGPLTIHWYALIILSGLLLAVFLATKEAPRRQIPSDDIMDFILIAFPLAILGARIYYVVFEWSYYQNHIMEIFAIWQGGLAIYGGLLTGGVVLFWYCYRKALSPIDFLDVAAPTVMIAQSIGRWGNFVNQEAYGKAVTQLDYLPDFIRRQMYIDGSYRVPTFLYESLWNLIGFIIILVLRRRPKLFRRGDITAFYLIWYGCGRFFIEGMRTDSLMLGSLRVSQWLSALLVVSGLVLYYVNRRETVPKYYHS